MCSLQRVRDRRKDMLILQGDSRSCPNLFKKNCRTADCLNLFNLDVFCIALVFPFACLYGLKLKTCFYLAAPLLNCNFVSLSNLSLALFCPGYSSCNFVRVNSTLNVCHIACCLIKFCGILNSSRPCT